MKKATLLQKIALTPKQWEVYSRNFAMTSFIVFLVTIPLLINYIYSTPFELTQGIHVRMLFLHVPCAFFSLAGYSALALLCAFFMIWRIKYCLYAAQSLVYPTCFLTLVTLITGSLWGAPTWGTYWIWDARLTSSFVLLLTLLVLAIIDSLPTANRAKLNRLFCIIALLGWMNIPFVHFSVEWFQTLHQGPSLSLFKPVTLDTPYLHTLLAALVHTGLGVMSMTCFQFNTLLRTKYGLHR